MAAEGIEHICTVPHVDTDWNSYMDSTAEIHKWIHLQKQNWGCLEFFDNESTDRSKCQNTLGWLAEL